MSGFAGGLLKGMAGGMNARKDRETRERQLSAMEAMGQQGGPVQQGLSLPMDVGPQGAMPRTGARPAAGQGSGGVRPRSAASTAFDESVLDGIGDSRVAASLKSAASTLGMNERDQRAALREYLANGGQNLDPAVTAWCAGFMNAALAQGGLEGTGKLNARSYMDWGDAVDEPRVGDVAVFSRGDPNGWQGHVGFYKGKDEHGNIRVLGGNQSDSVNISSYSPDRLLGYRRAPAAQPELSAAEAIQPQAAPAPSPAPSPAPAQPTTGKLASHPMTWAWARQLGQGAGS